MGTTPAIEDSTGCALGEGNEYNPKGAGLLADSEFSHEDSEVLNLVVLSFIGSFSTIVSCL